MSGIVSFSLADMPKAPHEVAEEVELYARESGRTGSLRFVPTLFVNGAILRGVWVIDFDLRSNDARMQLWRDGQAEKPPTEQVWLWENNPKAGQEIPNTFGQKEPPMVGLNINHLGSSGVRQFLEQGNSWSGRGEFDSPTDALASAREHNRGLAQKVRDAARDDNQREAPGLLKFLLGKRSIPVSWPWKKKAS